MNKVNLKNGETKIFDQPVKYYTLQTSIINKKSCIVERQGKFFKRKDDTYYISNSKYVEVMVSSKEFFSDYSTALMCAGIQYEEKYKNKLSILQKQIERMKKVVSKKDSFEILNTEKKDKQTFISYKYGGE